MLGLGLVLGSELGFGFRVLNINDWFPILNYIYI